MISIFEITLGVAAVVCLIYWYATRNFNYWKIRNVPHEKPLPIFGNVLPIILGEIETGHYLSKLYKKFEGPYYGFYTMDKPFLVLKDPEIIKRIMIKDFNIFQNRFFYNDENLDPIISNVLFGLKGQTWKFLRTKISPIFSTGKIKMMMPLMVECAENMVKYLETKADLNVETKELLAKYTTDVISSCSFGINANSFVNENSPMREAGRKLFKESFYRSIQTIAYVFAHGWVKLLRMKFVEEEAASFLTGVFHKAIAQREVTHNKRNDLIDILIELKNQETKEDQFKFQGDRLVAQAIIFFAAGHETTSSTITFSLYELACNQQIQTKLREEINTTFEEYGEFTYEVVQSMKYLHMVISETLRKYPLSPFLQRQCDSDYLIEETGLVIEKGVVVLIPLHGLQWDPDHFKEPHTYDPERFSQENKSEINSFTYLPFGGGPRNCIGERFALLNAKLGLLHVIRNFCVETNSFTKIPLVFSRAFLLQSSGGVPLTYRRVN